MRNSYARHVIACTMFFGMGHVSFAQEAANSRDKVPKSVEQRIHSVQRDLATTKDLPFWAGKFVEGDGLGENVTLYISPHAGVAVTNFGCLGLYGADEGLLAIQPNGDLRFGFSRQQSGASGGFADEVMPAIRQ